MKAGATNIWDRIRRGATQRERVSDEPEEINYYEENSIILETNLLPEKKTAKSKAKASRPSVAKDPQSSPVSKASRPSVLKDPRSSPVSSEKGVASPESRRAKARKSGRSQSLVMSRMPSREESMNRKGSVPNLPSFESTRMLSGDSLEYARSSSRRLKERQASSRSSIGQIVEDSSRQTKTRRTGRSNSVKVLGAKRGSQKHIYTRNSSMPKLEARSEFAPVDTLEPHMTTSVAQLMFNLGQKIDVTVAYVQVPLLSAQ